MIGLCVAKVGKNKYEITTTDMKEKLEAKYIEPRLADLEKRMERQIAMQAGALGRGFGGQALHRSFLG